MSKYNSIADDLRRAPDGPVRRTFGQLAALVPGGLPRSAYRWPEWWRGSSPRARHVQAERGWLADGRVVLAVDLKGEMVIFSGRTNRPR